MLALTPDKMNAIKVIMKNSPQHPLSVRYDEELTDDCKYKIPCLID